MKKFLTLTILSTSALLNTSLCQANSLDKHLWKHRVMIIFGKKDHSKEFIKFNDDLTERHIIYYQITPTDNTTTNNTAPSLTNNSKPSEKNTTHKNQIKADTIIVLIGKDGKLKQRWNKLNLKAIFALIDTMPMRKNEMRRNNH